MSPKKIRINEGIYTKQIRLIGKDGEQMGVVTPEEGRRCAQEAGLDLVEIAPQADPPVCRVMDFGKYLYAQTKKEKEAKKKQKNINVKEIKLSSNIGIHDYETKLRNAIRFLTRGDKVKMTLVFRGREMAHVDLGHKVIGRVTNDLEEYGQVEKNMGLEGRSITVIYSPKPVK